MRDIDGLPSSFDPADASPAFLAQYCLPPRPATELAYCNWRKALTGCRFPRENTDPPAMHRVLAEILRKHRTRSFSSREASQESSHNWSGAYVRPRGGGAFTLVQGRWAVPRTPNTLPSDEDALAYSVWIGLDGHDPASRLMPQVGIGYLVIRIPHWPCPVSGCFVWYQWWDWFLKKSWQQPVWQVAVREGDLIYAQVATLGVDRVSFFLKNETTGDAFTCYSTAPTSIGGDLRPVDPEIEGRTAEWIVERPQVPDHPDLPHPKLGRFGQADFSHCLAVTRLPDGTDQDVDLTHARTMRMADWTDRGQPGRIVSKPTIDRVARRIRLDYVGPP